MFAFLETLPAREFSNGMAEVVKVSISTFSVHTAFLLFLIPVSALRCFFLVVSLFPVAMDRLSYLRVAWATLVANVH